MYPDFVLKWTVIQKKKYKAWDRGKLGERLFFTLPLDKMFYLY